MHGLTIAERLQDTDGIRWATSGILRQSLTKDQQSLWHAAKRTAESTLERLKLENRTEEAQAFEAAIKLALTRDLVVRVAWTGDADIDMMIEEPSGTLCSLRNARTTAGGVMTGDEFARLNAKDEDLLSEYYVCSEAFNGEYRMHVRRVWGKLPAGKVTVEVYKHWRPDRQEPTIRQQIELANDGAMVIFDLQDGRRQEPLAQHQVANAAASQLALRSNVLTQQVGSLSGDGATLAFLLDRQRSLAAAGRPFFRRGQVGFQPVITTIPEGASLSPALAVISADRRYVRFEGVPNFMAIGEVNTFNFASGQSGMSQGGTGGQGFAGGGGQGGGGQGIGGGLGGGSF
jgi:hypothetical protein